MNDQQRYLSQVRIATPCSADWDKMTGDDRMRHCEQCNLDVFNISQMTTDEATRLIQNRTGRLCIQMYKRRDGTVITKDCPKGLERIKNSYRKCAAALAGVFSWSIALAGAAGPAIAQQTSGEPTTSNSCKIIKGKVAPVKEMGEAIMGDVALPEDMNNSKAPAPVVEQVNITKIPAVNTASGCALKPKESSNKPLALGLSLAAILAAAGFIFTRLKKRASLWLVGSSFAAACVTVGLIWHWFW